MRRDADLIEGGCCRCIRRLGEGHWRSVMAGGLRPPAFFSAMMIAQALRHAPRCRSYRGWLLPMHSPVGRRALAQCDGGGPSASRFFISDDDSASVAPCAAMPILSRVAVADAFAGWAKGIGAV